MKAVALAIAAALCLSPQPARAHPLHTSLAEITYDKSAREIRVSVRVFWDDFSKTSAAYAAAQAAAARAAGRPVSTVSPLLMYARASFMIADRSGRQLSLASCGGKRVGDLLWICFHASAPSGPSGLRVASRILFDVYADQINIVQATYDGRKANLLFTRGDGFKQLE